jgi:oxygen-independent coproporphyrinogen-3 oxidase
MKPLYVYVHFPFCLSKCAYCDFLSFGGEHGYAPYIDALCREIANSAVKLTEYEVKTIYFGGGTPMVQRSEDLKRVKKMIKDNYLVDKDIEVTIEANPESCDLRKLADLRGAGFNRVSIGVQSWNDEHLWTLGRAHTADTAAKAFEAARSAGFGNIGLDLMFALPSQSLDDWQSTLGQTVSLAPEHISCYGLTVEDGTPLSKRGDLHLPDDETDRAMYEMAKKTLIGAGYAHYEISNFAETGFASRHNSCYWTGDDYIGFGLGACSYIGGRRFQNITDLSVYTACPFESGYTETNPQQLTEREKMGEFMVLGLRMIEGIREETFYRLFNQKLADVYGVQVDGFVKKDLLKRNNGRIAFTDRGIDISNIILADFL